MPKIYVGNSSNKARKSKKIYIGNAYNVAKRCKKIYVGDSNNKARLAYCDLLTPLRIHAADEYVNFSYDNANYGPYYPTYGTYAPIPISISEFYLKNTSESIYFQHSEWYPGATGYDIDITGGETNDVYVMPPKTFFWKKAQTPIEFSYTSSSNNNGYVDSTNAWLYLHTNSINTDAVYIQLTFYCPYSGYLYVEASGMDLSSYSNQSVLIGNAGNETFFGDVSPTRRFYEVRVNPGYVNIRYQVALYGVTSSDYRLSVYRIYVI